MIFILLALLAVLALVIGWLNHETHRLYQHTARLHSAIALVATQCPDVKKAVQRILEDGDDLGA